MRILVTGGAGYIGSHTVLLLLEEGHEVYVYDNLSNSSPEALRRVAELTGKNAALHVGDLLDADRLEEVFESARPEAVIHFAGLKAVGESVAKPLTYYRNNVTGTLNLLEIMDAHNVRTFVFSSSATVYGETQELPITETTALSATNPYGRTKLHIEFMLDDLAASDPRWSIAKLRYFNPVGSHESGRIGEDPQGTPNNLMPFIAQVAVGVREKISVFGSDYPTPDGTGVRDYIHVVDLGAGHLAALEYLQDHGGLHAWNLGTGHGSSVLEVIQAFARTSKQEIPYEIVDRRPGDVAASYADPSLAREEIGWKAERGLEQMVEDMWRWQSTNPTGYPDKPALAVRDEEPVPSSGERKAPASDETDPQETTKL
ncbi:UDP-glucose 4-epimerase GalE [Paeniglutamicibacter kerguelensis]|uniref:UDP-glucose 4-epimerase n=1 Tax=Paeniglutamicibacter kerguelensis TaxID=254788 RepID=A0ABS4XAS9_9MICC|nr:UDP-glucose 4-epimerase GalE [Paeniglutamicibacter kerguelensis]MBP2385574.1 UDP-glucose 4-epimerase [Paeniglutamicibacter kerguelensis]